MSKKRQTKAPLDRRGRGPNACATLSYDYEAGHVVAEHVHAEDQLVHAVTGVMTVRTPKGLWVVPPQRAVWVPGLTPHAIAMTGAVTMKTVYLAPRLARRMPRSCCVVQVSPLLRELVVRACESRTLDAAAPRQAHLVALLVDEIEAAPTTPLTLPHPRDPRACVIADALVEDPGDARKLAALAKMAGASPRTIERVFRAETKMTFARWRQQLRLLHAMRLVAAGEKVSTAAVDAGFASASAFIYVFRRALGTTPGEYFKG
jgi:AraC-like DNA-binding protein